MRRLLIAAISFLFISVVVIAVSFFYIQQWLHTPNTLTHEVMLTIPPGTSTQSIIGMLEETGVTSNVLAWRLYLALLNTLSTPHQWKAGEYVFKPGITPAAVHAKLWLGTVVIHSVTIPEGLNSAEIIRILQEDDRLNGNIPRIEEGSLLPETYQIHRNDLRKTLVKRMQDAHAALFDGLWENRERSLPYATKQDALIMASIIEKETGIDGERDHIAGVFVNRLRQGMPLQSDPTVVYGIEQQEGPMNRALYRSDWKRDHDWNTYTRPGLPKNPDLPSRKGRH